jgi:4-amino-4-deoxy-L-arabinose transferase-like glycosyltransferase
VSETKLSNRAKFLIFAVGLFCRVFYVLAQYRYGVFGGSLVGADSPFYIEIAKNILAGNGMAYGNAPTAYVSPGYPIFLAGCFGVFGENLLWTSLFQCLLSALVCVFAALAAEIIFGRRVGLIAGLIACFYYELIFWTSGQILTEPLYTFLLAAAVYALIRASVSEKNAILNYSVAGALFGLAGLVRPIALVIALGIGILAIVISFFYQRKQSIHFLLFTAVCLLVMQPWGIRNYFVFNQYLLTSSESGHVLWAGNNPEFDLYEHPDFERYGGYTIMFEPPAELREELKGKSQMESDRIYSQRARQHIFDHPGAFVVRALHKTWNMWRPTFSGASFQNKLVSYTFYPILLLLSLTGIFLAWRSQIGNYSFKNFSLNLTKPVGLLSVFLILHLLLHAVVNGEIRFRVPLWIALIPFASFALVTIYDRAFDSKTRASS